MDLESVANTKKQIINELFEINNNLHILSGNALNINDYIKCEKFLNNNKELIIINEGLLRYLTFDEKKIVGQNIYKVLKKYGGVWITCDVTPKKFIKKQNEQNPTLNSSINTVTSRNSLNDRFENEEHIKTFFGMIGFNSVEIHKFIEVKDELKSFEMIGMDKNSCDELLENGVVAILKI